MTNEHYTLKSADSHTVELPVGAEIQCAFQEGGVLKIAVLVGDDRKETTPHEIVVVGAGDRIDDGNLRLLGTVTTQARGAEQIYEAL